MVVSGTRTYIKTIEDLIKAVLRLLRYKNFNSPEGFVNKHAMEALSDICHDLINKGVMLHTFTDDFQALTADTKIYTLASDAMEYRTVFWRDNKKDESPLTYMTREDYKKISNKNLPGEPNIYYIDYQLSAPVLYLYPVFGNTTTMVTGSDSNIYLATTDHTSSTDNEPITGGDYADNWELVTKSPNATWAADTNYYSGHVRFTKVMNFQDFNSIYDNPDFLTRNYLPFQYMLASELMLYYSGDTLTDRQMNTINKRAKEHKESLLDNQSDSADLTFTLDSDE